MLKLIQFSILSFLLISGTHLMAETAPDATTEDLARGNRSIVEGIYANFASGDINASIDAMSDEIVWEHPAHKKVPFAATFYGQKGVRQFFELAMSSIDVLDQRVNQIIASGDTVVALGNEEMRVKSNGNIYKSPWAHVYTFKNGKVVKFQEFIDTAEMVEAFTGGAK